MSLDNLPEFESQSDPVFIFCGQCRYFEPGGILDDHGCQKGRKVKQQAAKAKCPDKDDFPPGEGPGCDLTM